MRAYVYIHIYMHVRSSMHRRAQRHRGESAGGHGRWSNSDESMTAFSNDVYMAGHPPDGTPRRGQRRTPRPHRRIVCSGSRSLPRGTYYVPGITI